MRTIFKAIVGSQSYGTATPQSDTDYKGVYMQGVRDLAGFGYKEQYEVGKDETYYEARRFIQLLGSANPTVLEMLYSPEDCIIECTDHFDIIRRKRQMFLTKKCLHSFGGYAVAQIQKAKGLDKKMNWEKQRVERKTVLDFCYVLKPHNHFDSMPLRLWLRDENKRQQHIGLSKVNHFRDTYNVFYDHQAEMWSDNPRYQNPWNYRGAVKEEETSNDVCLSDIPKYAIRDTVMYFNKDAYSTHCKEYREYQEWLEKRNTTRYVETKNHKRRIDGKNLLHCRRLVDMAIEIATEGTINVRRPNADYLLQIRRGEVDLEKIIADTEADIATLNEVYEKSNLPAEVSPEFVNELLLEVRGL